MAIEIKELEKLKGKSILEVISMLPALPWGCVQFGDIKALDPKVNGLRLVTYQTKPHRVPKTEPDELIYFKVAPETIIARGQLDGVLSKIGPGRTLGITSAVDVDRKTVGSFIQGRRNFSPDLDFYIVSLLCNSLYGGVHMPFIDLEVEGNPLPKEKLIDRIKEEIRQKTKTERGILLTSGRNNHFHFIGADRLLSPDDFVDFMADCLNMDINGRPIVDPFWVGHSLRANLGLTKMFSTLRITTSEVKQRLPVVVDIL